MPSADVIVIGLGGMGGAAALHLARRGARVLGIEQFGVAHDRGSSHGQTRIIRKAYFEHPDYVPLLHRTYDLWGELEQASGRQLITRAGLMLAGPPDGEIASGVRAAAEQHDLDIQPVPAGEVSERFRGFRFDPAMDVLFEADAGFLRVEDCVRAHIEQAIRHGARLIFGRTVRGWSADAGGVAVWTDDERYTADHLVVTVGPWAGRLLTALAPSLEVRRKVQTWFACDAAAYLVEDGSPVFGMETAEGFFYGFPAVEPGVVKVAEHTGRQTVGDPDEVDRALHPDDLTRVRRFVAEHLPLVGPDVVNHSVCMYTMTPDEQIPRESPSSIRTTDLPALAYRF